MAAGAWMYAALMNRWTESLSGTASWAAGIIIEATLLAGESSAMALLFPHPHVQLAYVAMLVLPLGAGAAIHWWLILHETPRSARRDRVSGRPLLALVIVVAVEIMFEVVKLRGTDYGLVMGAATGDARNQVWVMRSVLWSGGITLPILKIYPAMSTAMGAIFAGAGGRSHLPAGTLMVRDVQAFMAIFMLSSVAVCAMFAAAIAELISPSNNGTQRQSRLYLIPLLACASLGIGAFILAPAFVYGFASAIGALAFVMAAMVLALRMAGHRSAFTLMLLSAAFLLVTFSWTILASLSGGALLIGCVMLISDLVGHNGRRNRLEVLLSWSSIALAAFLFVLVAAGLYTNRVQLMAQLREPGGVLPAHPHPVVWIGLIAVVVMVLAPTRQQLAVRLMMLGMFAAVVGATLWTRHIAVPPSTWSYYATKVLWLATAAMLWVPFVVVTDLMRWLLKKYPSLKFRLAAKSSAIVITVVAVIGSGVILNFTTRAAWSSTFSWATVGVLREPAYEFALVTKEGNQGGAFVIWDYESYDDQIGNFYAGITWAYGKDNTPLSWGPIWPHSFSGWPYIESPSIVSLCFVLERVQLRVVTANPKLSAQLHRGCSASALRAAHKTIDVQLVPPPPDWPGTFY